jgi:hypothetical protein
MDIIKLKCLGGDVFFSNEDIPENTFLSALISWEEDVTNLSVNEPKEIVSNLMASIKYGKILDDNVSLKHMFMLAQSWTFPQEILDTLEDTILKKIDNEYAVQCKICNIGFKESENTSTSCKSHTSHMHGGTYLFHCCGKNFDNPCCLGYHIKI